MERVQRFVFFCAAAAVIFATHSQSMQQGPPVQVPLFWPHGYSSTPVVGHPFRLTCPLEGYPPLTYTWERYTSIDMQTPPLSLPPTLTFGEGNRSWEVDSFSAEENGLYVCRGANVLGNDSYVNIRHFYLNADKCSQHYQGSANILVTGDSPYQAPLGSTLILHCTVTPVQRLRPGRPQWWRVRSEGGKEEEELPPVTAMQHSYNEESCSWHTSLTIASVSHETIGQYFCGLAGLEQNVTVSIKESTPAGASLLVAVLLVPLLAAAMCAWCIRSSQLSQVWGSMAQWAYQEPRAVGYRYDVFISSHLEASDLAHDRLFKGLEAWSPQGYRVCWHERDFLTGATILQNISEAIHSSRKVVVVLSKRFMESQFCRMELDLALHRMHSSRTRCLIPIALDEGSVPAELRRKITYWPLRGSVVKEGGGGEEELMRKLTCLIGDPIEVNVTHVTPSCSHG